MIENTVLLATALLAAAWLFRPALRRSTNWIATVTPLASIIGSGFLVVAPLLAHAVDGWALVAAVLPAMLVVAAVMSQFSAAVADTAGGGGLFSEFSRRRVSLQRSYLLVVLATIVVVWSANIFEIIVLASRAFAFYYFLQCLVGLAACSDACSLRYPRLWRAYLVLMALVLLLVVLFAISDS